MRGRSVVLIIALCIIMGIPWIQTDTARGQSSECETLVSRALSELGTNCAGLGPDGACYGFSKATATLFEGIEQPDDFFSKPGDQVDLAQVESISTGLFSEEDAEWGIAVLNVQLGSASASQSTVYMMMGDAEITNLVVPPDEGEIRMPKQAPMQVFTLVTGEDSTECLSVPPSSLIVQSPDGVPVTIRVNNVDIQLSSTIMLRAPDVNHLQIMTGNGGAVLFPDAPNRVEVPAGVSINTVVGERTIEWQNWRVMSEDEWSRFAPIEDVSQNILHHGYWNPRIVCGSGVGRPHCYVELPWGVFWPRPHRWRPFPLIAMHFGRIGQPLTRGTWTPLTIGADGCEKLVFFHSNREDNWDIYGLDLASGLVRNISQYRGGADIQPTVSPDGQWLAYVSDRDPLGSWEIYVSKVDGSETQRVTYNTAIDAHPVWGTGGRIVFESNRDGRWGLYMVDVTGEGTPEPLIEADSATPQRLAQNETHDLGAFWYPDGEHIAFESDRDGDWEIYRLNVFTGELVQLTENNTIDRQAIVSHDGKTLAWLQADEVGVENLWLMELETGKSVQVTDTGYNAGGVEFAPDDTFLVYHMLDTDGDSEIFAYEVETAVLKTLTDNEVDDRAPTFCCEVSQVIYQSLVDDVSEAEEQYDGQYELFIVNPLPLDGPADAPVRLMVQQDADDVFAMNNPRAESNTRPILVLDFSLLK